MTRRAYPLPTPRQTALLVALVVTGSLPEAAARIGVTTGTAAVMMRHARRRTGLSDVQLVAAGIRDGWLVLAA